MTRIEEFATHIRGPHEHAAYDSSTDAAELRAKQLDAIAKSAFNNLRTYGNCCRSTLWSLQTHLRLDNADILRATATLAGGIGGTGETCGAVIGALMGIGLHLGSLDFCDTQSTQACLAATGQFVKRFTARFDTTRCHGVQKATIGWCCDDPDLMEKWVDDDGPIACAGVCAEAARIAADLILGSEDEADG